MLYAATLSEYQRLVHWRLIIEVFGPNIYNIYGVYNIAANKIIRIKTAIKDQYLNSNLVSVSFAIKLFQHNGTKTNMTPP